MNREIVFQSNAKKISEVRKHFIYRLKERYGITITSQQYLQLVDICPFTFVFKRKSDSHIGYITLGEQKVWVLFDHNRMLYTTAYPADIYDNDENFLRAAFSKQIFDIVQNIHSIIKKEMSQHLEIKFDSRKEAAIYYFSNSPFASLLLNQFLYGKWEPVKMVCEIRDIMTGKHKKCKLTLNINKKGS